MDFKEILKNRFLRYISVDTQSSEDSETTPSTAKQFDLAKIVKSEMETLGLKDISLDDKCYLMGTLPANTDKKVPFIGFLPNFTTVPICPEQISNLRL